MGPEGQSLLLSSAAGTWGWPTPCPSATALQAREGFSVGSGYPASPRWALPLGPSLDIHAEAGSRRWSLSFV